MQFLKIMHCVRVSLCALIILELQFQLKNDAIKCFQSLSRILYCHKNFCHLLPYCKSSNQQLLFQ